MHKLVICSVVIGSMWLGCIVKDFTLHKWATFRHKIAVEELSNDGWMTTDACVLKGLDEIKTKTKKH